MEGDSELFDDKIILEANNDNENLKEAMNKIEYVVKDSGLKPEASNERSFTRVASDPLLCYHNIEAISALGDSMEAEMAQIEAKEQAQSPWLMISGAYTPQAEKALCDALDHLCPPLQSTSKLQDKALRVALSMEVELALMDAESCALTGKFSLLEEQLLAPKDTEAVFEQFIIPA
jgi:hypothetical protein